MAKYSDDFQAVVCRWLDEAGISDREAARRSRGAVSHYTVGMMRKGEVPGAEQIVALAVALNRDADELLQAAGKGWFSLDARAYAKAYAGVRQPLCDQARSVFA